MKTILVDAWNTFVLEDGINSKMYDLLESYDNPKIILTNANSQQIKELGMTDLPYELFTLNQNPKKTEDGYYEKFLEENNLNAEECIYFEHNLDAVEKAKSLGITTHHYDKEKKDLDSLKKFLDENLQ